MVVSKIEMFADGSKGCFLNRLFFPECSPISGNRSTSLADGSLTFRNRSLTFGNNPLTFGNNLPGLVDNSLAFGNKPLSFGNHPLALVDKSLTFGNGPLTLVDGSLTSGNCRRSLQFACRLPVKTLTANGLQN
jgi:hypothetical protein